VADRVGTSRPAIRHVPARSQIITFHQSRLVTSAAPIWSTRIGVARMIVPGYPDAEHPESPGRRHRLCASDVAE
jgi:hypothetical protein